LGLVVWLQNFLSGGYLQEKELYEKINEFSDIDFFLTGCANFLTTTATSGNKFWDA